MRRIIHMDRDAFFAQVEQLDHPQWRGKPLIVGGNSDRGVVATCSYEARKYGVRSAMSTVVAKKLCPNAIFVSGNMARYMEISKQIFTYLESQYTIFEQVSVDEAYIDVTDETLCALEIAKKIKDDVLALTGLTISVGISYNKFLAKLASEWEKPNGLFVIHPEMIPHILLPLPIGKIHGLGKKSCERLNRIGIFTVGDLYVYPKALVFNLLGEAWGNEIIQYIHGVDTRPVQASYERKSYGKETTLSCDTSDKASILSLLHDYLETICCELDEKKLIAKTLTLKIKYSDFEQFTKRHSLEHHTMHSAIWHQTLDCTFDSIDLRKPVRLVGVTLSNFESEAVEQFHWFDL